MSYVRFSTPNSDLYIYDDVAGYTCCCCCRLTPDDRPTIFEGITMHSDAKWPLEDWDAFFAHLAEHVVAGHRVPKYLMLLVEKEGRRAAQSKQGTP